MVIRTSRTLYRHDRMVLHVCRMFLGLRSISIQNAEVNTLFPLLTKFILCTEISAT